MTDDITEFDEIDIDELHLVGTPASGFRSPVVAKSAESDLSALYRRWRATQERATKAILATGDEAQAMKKSGRRMAKLLERGMAPSLAVTAGHREYVRHGGSADFNTWARRIAEA